MTGSRSFVPPPPAPEQRLLRREDPSVVPALPYLLLSKSLDAICDGVPVLGDYACPDAAVGGWRSLLPDPAWGTFPNGRLSHSFVLGPSGHDRREDLSFGDYYVRSSQEVSAKGGIAGALGNCYDFAFRTDDTTLGNLTHPSTLGVLLVLVLFVRSVKAVLLPRFSAVGRRLGRSARGPDWEAANADRIGKFGEYVWRLLFHASLSAYGVAYARGKPWWDDARGGTRNLWEGSGSQSLDPGMAWYYLVQCAYNVDALVSLLEISFVLDWVNPLAYSGALDPPTKKDKVAKAITAGPERRGSVVLWTPLFEVRWSPAVREDFAEMMVHHLATNFLVFASSAYEISRAGSVVFLLHDLSDVPIDVSKLIHFVKWDNAQVVAYFVMLGTWIVTRLYLFPVVVIQSVAMESREYVVTRGVMDPAMYDVVYSFVLAGLVALLLLHVMWFAILLRIAFKFLTKGERHDYSEHKNGENASEKDLVRGS